MCPSRPAASGPAPCGPHVNERGQHAHSNFHHQHQQAHSHVDQRHQHAHRHATPRAGRPKGARVHHRQRPLPLLAAEAAAARQLRGRGRQPAGMVQILPHGRVLHKGGGRGEVRWGGVGVGSGEELVGRKSKRQQRAALSNYQVIQPLSGDQSNQACQVGGAGSSHRPGACCGRACKRPPTTHPRQRGIAACCTAMAHLNGLDILPAKSGERRGHRRWQHLRVRGIS